MEIVFNGENFSTAIVDDKKRTNEILTNRNDENSPDTMNEK